MDNEVQINLENFMNEILPQVLQENLEKACQHIENVSKSNCPVDDGQLRASITHVIEQEGNNYVGYVGSNVEYAPYVHEGTGLYAKDGMGRKDVPWTFQGADGSWHKTSGQKPQPFLQDAVDAEQAALIKFFEGGF